MNKIVLILAIQLIAFNAFASYDSVSNQNSLEKKIFIGAETNIRFVESDLIFDKKGFDLGLNLNYYLNKIAYVGAFYNQMNDVWNTTANTFVMDSNTVNISTANFNNFGFLAGYRMIENKNFVFIPELRVGYGSLAFKGINTEKIQNAEMITFDFRANLGYKVSNSSIIGLSAGYMKPFYLDRSDLSDYSLRHASVGAFFKTAIGKTSKKGYVRKVTTSNVVNEESNSSLDDFFNKVDTTKIEEYNSSTKSESIGSFSKKSIDNSQTRTNVSENLSNYTIVIASYEKMKNAVSFINKIKDNSNRKYSVLYDSEIKRYRVVFMVTKTRSEVIELRDNTRKEFPGTWILDFEN